MGETPAQRYGMGRSSTLLIADRDERSLSWWILTVDLELIEKTLENV